MTPPPPVKSKAKKALEALIACSLVAGLSIFGTRLLLETTGFGTVYTESEVGQVELSPSILEEPDDFVADVRAAAAILRSRWAYAEYRQTEGVDLDDLESEALTLLGEAPTAERFRRALLRLTAALRDGHAGVVFPAEIWIPTRAWPFALVEVVEGLCVDGIFEGCPELERGDLLLSVDDVPVEALLAEAESFACASTPLARRHWALSHLVHRGTETKHRFRFRRVDGTELALPLATLSGGARAASMGALGSSRESRLLESDLGYFRPGNFSPPPGEEWKDAGPEVRNTVLEPAYREFDEHLEGLAGSRGIVLDLRGNPGGTDLLGQFLVDRLLEQQDYVYYRLSGLGARGWRSLSSHGSSAAPGRTELRQPLAVLIDELTFSTADNVVACLAQHHPDVTFIGRPNGAGSGAPRGFTLPRTGTRIFFCTQRVADAGGQWIEGHAVQPAVFVRRTREDLLAGRDPALEQAIRLLADR